jgi:hypothetical protein
MPWLVSQQTQHAAIAIACQAQKAAILGHSVSRAQRCIYSTPTRVEPPLVRLIHNYHRILVQVPRSQGLTQQYTIRHVPAYSIIQQYTNI